MEITIPFEGHPYVRMVQKSWFAAKEGSSIANYLAWKDRVAEFWQGSYADQLPIEVPIDAEIRFVGSKSWAVRDLDNMVKGILDALNPRLKLKPPSIAFGPYIDDRQIRAIKATMTPVAAARNLFNSDPCVTVEFNPVMKLVHHLGIFRTIGYLQSSGDVLHISQSAVSIPVDCYTVPETGVRHYYVVKDGGYKLFSHVDHAMLYLLASTCKPKVKERTIRLLRESTDDEPVDVYATKLDGFSGFAVDRIAALTPKGYVTTENIWTVEYLAVQLYESYGCAWPASRDAVRSYMLTHDVVELAAIAAGCPKRKVKTKGKAKK